MGRSHNGNILIQVIFVAAWIVAAVFLALVVIPAPWGVTSGRDFRPEGFSLSVILLASGVFIRYRLRWPWLSIVLGLLAVEILALVVIGHFSGSTGTHLFSRFNLLWLASINLYIGAPWLMGAGIGQVFLRYKERRSSAR